ncbi:MAG: tRNA (adenosine(37)-N6)-threonylcarbamoyltransferase complex dimerization subunit type 1 TsaB [Ruminococcaceae bacterium]|nr:tRNA (adenosine(37)-N6)-threonylcarbamoyltransferase complex dimerization subunit type 1 TsaB [Oscillospiraceae bacterium]
MLILSIDSSAVAGSVALCDGERLLSEYTVNLGNTHSETLLPMIEHILKLSGYTTDDIDIFACSEGPGSFTGIRIGAATIKGLAFSTGKPCIGVSTLEALAYNLCGFDGIICPVMNARRGQVYNAVFDKDLNRLTEDRAIAASDLARELENYDRVYLCGDGTRVALDGGVHAIAAPERLLHQSGYSVAQCALKKFALGVRTGDTELAPVYLRLPQAERVRLEKISGSIESNERILQNETH